MLMYMLFAKFMFREQIQASECVSGRTSSVTPICYCWLVMALAVKQPAIQAEVGESRLFETVRPHLTFLARFGGFAVFRSSCIEGSICKQILEEFTS
jgi:hypothetical protein